MLIHSRSSLRKPYPIADQMGKVYTFRCNVKIPAKMPRYLEVGVKLLAPRRLHAVKYALNSRH